MFQFTERGTVNFYLKSGNVVAADNVNLDKFEYTYQGNTITRIEGFSQRSPKCRLAIQSLDLSQIEAIVITKIQRYCLR